MRVTEITPLSVALVGCGKSKVDTAGPIPAKDLYKSTLFRMSVQYAQAVADDFHILSAKHGLLSPYELISSYDTRIDTRDAAGWGGAVVTELLECYGTMPLEIHVLAGRQYFAGVSSSIKERRLSWPCINTFGSRNLFQRLRWLKERLNELPQ